MSAVDPDCLFCKIAGGEIPADVVAETDLSLAFRDLNPQAPTHVLVIPRRHSPTLPELADDDPASAADVLTLTRQVALDAGIEGGYRVVFNNGEAAGQSVFHAHAHVLGGRPFTWPPG
jgi:histidine triad (HIT) family protein